MRCSCRRTGWTLVEVLVVICVLGVLFALLVPAVLRAREASNRAACAQNLRQLVLAAHTCQDATGTLPPYSSGQPGTSVFGGWWIHLMPYAGDTSFHDEIVNASAPTSTDGGMVASVAAMQPRFKARRFPLLTCSSDPTLGSFFATGTSNYLANWFVFGDLQQGCYGQPQKLRNVEHGLSNAVLFAEGYSTCNGLMREALIACGTHNFGITWHGKPSDDASYLPESYLMFQIMPPVSRGGCNSLRAQTAHANMPVAFADGSVRLIEPNISEEAWTTLMKAR